MTRLIPRAPGRCTRRIRKFLIIFMLSCFGAAACFRFIAPSRKGSGLRTPLVMITVDTLRADALHCYDERAAETPNLDQLARTSVKFENARSTAPWTVPSVASLMTGVSPATHKMGRGSRLSDKFETLAERLKHAGYHTEAVGSNLQLLSEYGFDQGFDRYRFYPQSAEGGGWNEPNTGELADMAIETIRQNRTRDFFLWLHFFDPHEPYSPPEEWLPAGKAPQGMGAGFQPTMADWMGKRTPTEEELRWIRALYHAEVEYMDDQLGRVLEALAQSGLYSRSLIVLTSDHGEEFWEHGRHGHGHALTPEILDVPLIVKPPESTIGTEIEEPVSTLALMPTILDMLQLEYDADGMSARSLAELVRGGGLGGHAPEPLFSMGTTRADPMIAVEAGGAKYLLNLATRAESYFDLAADPREMNPRPGPMNAVAAALPAALDRFMRREAALVQAHGIGTPEVVYVDGQTLQKLRELGYLN